MFPTALYSPRWLLLPRQIPQLAPRSTQELPHAGAATNLVLVTGASSGFFERLPNLVGSVHTWEPNMMVWVYDLGLTSAQRAQVACWRNVQVVDLPWDDLPEHITRIANYGAKLLTWVDASQRLPGGAVLYADAGVEIRAPLDSIRHLLERDGVFLSRISGFVGDQTHPTTLAKYGVSQQDVAAMPFCAGGLVGVVSDSKVAGDLMDATLACVLEEECLDPPGATKLVHNYDQSALSIAAGKQGLQCHPQSVFLNTALFVSNINPKGRSDPVVINSRRHHYPKPYVPMVRRLSTCPAPPPPPQHALDRVAQAQDARSHMAGLRAASGVGWAIKTEMREMFNYLGPLFVCPTYHALVLALYAAAKGVQRARKKGSLWSGLGMPSPARPVLPLLSANGGVGLPPGSPQTRWSKSQPGAPGTPRTKLMRGVSSMKTLIVCLAAMVALPNLFWIAYENI
ncbi:unnamed protein product [Pedinophyceae sp. YPF-701]|nr:unnamed protein product [Pedinophyceae sp. YPF-701]